MLHVKEISHEKIEFKWKKKFINFDFFDFKGKIAKFRKIWIFKINSALKCTIVRKFHLRRQDLNSTIFANLKFSFFGMVRRKNVTFRKIQIFKQNSALNYSTVKKFHMRKNRLENNNNNKKYFQRFQIFFSF